MRMATMPAEVCDGQDRAKPLIRPEQTHVGHRTTGHTSRPQHCPLSHTRDVEGGLLFVFERARARGCRDTWEHGSQMQGWDLFTAFTAGFESYEVRTIQAAGNEVMSLWVSATVSHLFNSRARNTLSKRLRA